MFSRLPGAHSPCILIHSKSVDGNMHTSLSTLSTSTVSNLLYSILLLSSGHHMDAPTPTHGT